MKSSIGQGLGESQCRSFCPCGAEVCLPSSVDVFTKLKALQTLYYWDFCGGFLTYALLLNHVQLCNPLDLARQAPPSMGFSRQAYWGGLPFPFPGDLPDPGIGP